MSNNSYTQDRKPNELSSTPNVTFTLQELHIVFIKHKLHGARNALATIRNYRQNFDLLIQFKPDIKLADLTEDCMIGFLEFLNTRERKVGKQQIIRAYKNSSILAVRSKLNGFFNWLLERHFIEINPFSKIPYPQVSYTDRRAFSSTEFEIICHAVNTKIQWANLLIKKRNIAITMFLALTGLRKEELLGLLLSDIDIERKYITVRAETSKSKRTRIIPINSILIQYLVDYLTCRKDYKSSSLWVSGTVDFNCFFIFYSHKSIKEFIRDPYKLMRNVHYCYTVFWM